MGSGGEQGALTLALRYNLYRGWSALIEWVSSMYARARHCWCEMHNKRQTTNRCRGDWLLTPVKIYNTVETRGEDSHKHGGDAAESGRHDKFASSLSDIKECIVHN